MAPGRLDVVSLVTEYRGWRQRRRLAITCQAAVELMTDYLEGALSEIERRRFERHLHYCPACLRVLDQLRATVETVGRLDPDRVDPDVRDGLLSLYRNFHSDS